MGRYRVVEATDLRTRTKSYKIYEHAHLTGARPPLAMPVMVGFATRDEAEAKIREMEGTNNR